MQKVWLFFGDKYLEYENATNVIQRSNNISFDVEMKSSVIGEPGKVHHVDATMPYAVVTTKD